MARRAGHMQPASPAAPADAREPARDDAASSALSGVARVTPSRTGA